MYYPPEVFNRREDITQHNMKRYDAWRRKVWDIFYERFSHAERDAMHPRVRWARLREIEEEVGPWY